jgi:enoyl-[acyl-carrier protein] reductase II
MTSRITSLFSIEHPIIQAGMIWVAGQRLASAVSNAGGLGLIGAGSMKPELLREHIAKCRAETNKPFGVNLPLIRGDVEELAKVILEEKIDIVFCSAGNPARFVPRFKDAGIRTVQVIAAVKHAQKAQQAGCDAVVAEGFEAGGHNGIDETTTMCLVPQVVDAVDIPVIAAGGIATGRQIYAALALGAEGVQIGTRFAVTVESSAHEHYKTAVVAADDAGTVLTLKQLTPVRLVKNKFAADARSAELRGASRGELESLLGKKRERAGIFEGDVDEGELEAGQSSGLVNDIPTAGEVMSRLIAEYEAARARMAGLGA